jgi:hypothetical protein
MKSFLKQELEQDDEEELDLAISSLGPSTAEILLSAPAKVAKRFGELVACIDADNFRWFHPKWITTMHVALVMIESESFGELVCTIAPALDCFMVFVL